ncbi:MAG: SdrD B-like domain-containing protein, partial [Pseudomonadota bacterium]
TVHLRQDNQTVATATTNQNGWYQFSDVPVGTGYSVRFYKPDGMEYTASEGQSVGSAENLNSAPFAVSSGAQVSQVNGLLEETPSDPNTPPSGEVEAPPDTPPVANPDTFQVSGSTPSVLDVVANDTDAETPRADLDLVSVSAPAAGSVEIVDDTIHFTPDYTAYRTTDGGLSGTAEETFTYRIADEAGNLSEAQVTVALDFEPGEVTGWVFADGNGNGAFDDGVDTGAVGYEVQLRFGDETVATTTTLAGGFYRFEDVPAGDGYQVRFIDQAGTEFVPGPGQSVGGANNLNTASFEVAPGATVRQVNGIVQEVAIGGNAGSARLELGTLSLSQEARGLWTRVDFDSPIPDAIVVMGPLSANGDEATVRVRNVDETGFEVQIDEWMYYDGWHMAETVSWMAATEGSHRLPDGTVIQAGRTVAESDIPSAVTFETAFEAAPLVFTQLASDNGSDAAVTRNADVSGTGFSVQMQEEELRDQWHVPEQIDWIAVEQSDGILAGGTESVDHEFKTLDLSPPEVFLADVQTMAGVDTINLRYEETADGGLRIKLDEETSLDLEKEHLEETVAFLAANAGTHLLTEFDAA